MNAKVQLIVLCTSSLNHVLSRVNITGIIDSTNLRNTAPKIIWYLIKSRFFKYEQPLRDVLEENCLERLGKCLNS